MRRPLQLFVASFLLTWTVTPQLEADEQDAKKLVEQVVKMAGGEEKLLKLFRFR